MRLLGCVFLLVTLVGCPKPPPPLHQSKDIIGGPQAPDTNPAWSTALPPDLREVRLHAYDDCVFVTGEKSSSDSTRAQLCVSPDSGDIVWAHEIDVSVTAHRDEDVFHAASNHFVYANRKEIIGLNRANGARDWVFKDPTGLPVYNTVGQGDLLVTSLGNRKLATLNAADGTFAGGYALRDESLKQLVTTQDGTRYALMIAVDTASKAPPSLVAIKLDQDMGKDLGAELPPAKHAWSTPIESWTSDVSVVGNVILGSFTEGEWWALDATTGEKLWSVRESALRSKPIFTEQAILLHRTESPEDQPKAGFLEMISIDPRTLPDQTARWTLTLSTGTQLLGIEEQQSDPRTLGATLDTLFQFDSKTGRLLWSFTFDRKREPGQWTNASSNGEAVFLYFEIPGKSGTLKRIPIVTE